MKRLTLISCIGPTLISVAYLSQSAVAAGWPSRSAEVLRSYELPPLSLTEFGYTQQELDHAAASGLSVSDKPAIGSGLAHLQGNWFVGITDRGPNLDHFKVDSACVPSGSSNGKTFPIPQFTPALVIFHATGGQLVPESIVNLVTPNGDAVTGLTNLAGDDAPYDDACSNTAIPFNPNGMDVEDLALLPNKKLIGVEENRPSLFIADLSTGIVERRFIPKGQQLTGAGYPVSDVLPQVLKNRRNNRGFESIALSSDGSTAYTATQSPLGSTSSSLPYRDSRVLRILKLDVADPAKLQVTGQFVLLMSERSVYPAGINQRDLKLSAMAWVGPDQLLLLERSDEKGRGGVRLLLAELSQATDIQGMNGAETLDVEDVNKGPAYLNITPATTSVIFEEFETDAVRQFPSYKLEGMAILNPNQVAIVNDNDFAVEGTPNIPTQLWVLRLQDALPIRR